MDDHHIVDDETFDQKAVPRPCGGEPQLAEVELPVPGEIYGGLPLRCEAGVRGDAVRGAERLLQQRGVLGKNLYHEEYGQKDIYVFNSRSASVGETLIARKIGECEEAGMAFDEVVRTVEDYIESQHTYFVLETLETLRKNGRLKGIKSPGCLGPQHQARHGLHAPGHDLPARAGQGHEESAGEDGGGSGPRACAIPEEKVLAISHCNCPDRARRGEGDAP